MSQTEKQEPPSITQRMRISTRIYASIGALLVLFVLAVSIACFGLLNLKTKVATFAEADRFATLIDRIDRDIVELQRDVLIYSFTGNPAAPERVTELGDALRTEIEQAQTLAKSNEKIAYRLNEMQARLESYLKRFPEVVAERTTRRKLVEERLKDLEAATRPAFDKLRQSVDAAVGESADAATQSDEAIIVERAMSSVALAQINALRFFNDPDVANVRATTALLKEATDSLKQLSDGEDAGLAQNANDMIDLLAQYESAFLRAVQATRGYLSLVNVVMAGEAAEFLYQSKQIQARTAERTEQISAETLAIAGRTNLGVAVFAVVAILASIVVTTLSVRGIVNPISEMTNTFARLMHGENSAIIPGLHRRDEMGDMARAADMFRSRNQQTEELLLQTQNLANELDSKASELARSNADLNSFAYVASHDLRSPLRAIDNIATWLEEDLGDSIPEESKSLLVELRRRVVRMEQLLGELLEYSRVGRQEIRVSETNLRELIEETAQLVDLPTDANVVIEEPMPTILADRGSLTRVILNLLSNSIKYRGEEPLRIQCECEQQGTQIVLSVTDNGIGIAPKFHERIFVMFKRLHSQSQIEGSGMGLALVQKLVEQAGGEISVQSQEGKGAAFRFTWPVDPSLPDEPPHASAVKSV